MASLWYEGVLDRFPKLKICVAHGGGYLPYYAGRMDRNYEDKPFTRVHMKKKPSDYIKHMKSALNLKVKSTAGKAAGNAKRKAAKPMAGKQTTAKRTAERRMTAKPMAATRTAITPVFIHSRASLNVRCKPQACSQIVLPPPHITSAHYWFIDRCV